MFVLQAAVYSTTEYQHVSPQQFYTSGSAAVSISLHFVSLIGALAFFVKPVDVCDIWFSYLEHVGWPVGWEAPAGLSLVALSANCEAAPYFLQECPIDFYEARSSSALACR